MMREKIKSEWKDDLLTNVICGCFFVAISFDGLGKRNFFPLPHGFSEVKFVFTISCYCDLRITVFLASFLLKFMATDVHLMFLTRIAQ